jgi:hypothetical protein
MARRAIRLAVLVLGVIAAPPPTMSQGTTVETCPFRGTILDFDNGSRSAWSMTPVSGRPCLARINAWGAAEYEGITIVAEPRNGTVRANGRSGVIYQSRTGFRGADAFSARLCGRVSGRPGCVVLDFAVDVR